MAFKGATLLEQPDFEKRLGSQKARVIEAMSDGEWRDLEWLAKTVAGSEAGVSARLRDLRREGFLVERKHLVRGYYVYRVTRKVEEE